ncbi:MAG: hypothetical protein HQL11_05395, partial [Candidatus Omnitrophica bacterium]|nr:hypothetical protein [Candidatus Omnitrophota bacterium]
MTQAVSAALRVNPHLIQINAAFFLSRMRRKHGSGLTLSAIPDREWRAFKDSGFDCVYLLGVWRRSPGSRKKALKEPNLIKAYDLTLPGWKAADVGGSSFSIADYSLEPFLGRADELGDLRQQLNRLGLKLILDFVPNHLAFDHPWTREFPDRFVRCRKETLKTHPEWFFNPGPGLEPMAHGRDPYYAAWNDTVQLDHFNPETRSAMKEELLRIAEVCDGVRCDMSMLVLTEVFEWIWGRHLSGGFKRPKKEFWGEAIGEVRKRWPAFVFIAEVYWQKENRLLELGFDYTYDKPFADALLGGTADSVRSLLGAEQSFQARMARFTENHDEERSRQAAGDGKSAAAAAALATLPGLRFIQDGQMEGHRVRTPIHLLREAETPVDARVLDRYGRILEFADHDAMHSGVWNRLDAEAVGEWDGHENLLAWTWVRGADRRLVVINYADSPSKGRVRIPDSFVGSEQTVRLSDRWADAVYERHSAEMVSEGLYIALDGWQAHYITGDLSAEEFRGSSA